MAPPRYDSKKVRLELDNLAGDDRLSVMTIPDARLPRDVVTAVTEWQIGVLRSATTGLPADLELFPGLALTADTPAGDPRWKAYSRAYMDLLEMGELGLVLALERPQFVVTALQAIADDEWAHVRINQAIRGVFWALVSPDWLQVGFELPADERDHASHLTVLEGRAGGQQASLVFWNVNPSVIREATPARLLEMEDRSIGVSHVRSRWFQGKEKIDPEEIRSALYLADKTGIHPDERGTFIADYIFGRRGRDREVRESDICDDFLVNQVDPVTTSPEEEVLRLEEIVQASERLATIRATADPDEALLLDAWQKAFLEQDDKVTVAGIARELGVDVGAAEAVLKRLRRRLGHK